MKCLWFLIFTAVQVNGGNDQSRILFPEDDKFASQSRSSGFEDNVKFGRQYGIKTTHRNYGSSNDNSDKEDFHIEDIPGGNIITHVKTVSSNKNSGPPSWFPHPGNPQPGFPHTGNPQSGHPYFGHPQSGHPHYGHPQSGHPHFGHPQSGLPNFEHPQFGFPHIGHPNSGHPGNLDGRPFPSLGDSMQTYPGIKSGGIKSGGIKSGGIKSPGGVKSSFTTSQTYIGNYPTFDVKKDTKDFLIDAQRMPSIGGCTSFKKLPTNSNVKCQDITQTCRVTCMKGYKFPTGASSLQVSCVDNEWVIKDSEWLELPSCEPICIPTCQNNGICIAPGLCKCPQNYHGPVCQDKKVYCPSYPPVPNNSNMSCNPSQCTIQCLKGYKFPDGSQITNMACDDGQWKHTKSGRASSPECEPTCNPACKNGGTCQGYNSCLCLKNFRGPQCQFDNSFCNISQTGFNGIYSCTFKQNEAICQIRCPPPIEFQFPPADNYVCEYNLNTFKPAKIPNCIFPPGTTIIRGGEQTIERSRGGIKTSVEYGQEKQQISLVQSSPVATFKSVADGVYSLYVSSNLIMKSPAPAMCATWGGGNVKTFDGLMYKTPLHCTHTLMKDKTGGTFSINLKACPYGDKQDCAHSIQIFFDDVLYNFANDNGVVTLKTPKKTLPVPVQILGMNVVPVAHFIKIDFDKIGVTIYWDKGQYILIEASAKWWDRTSGLCGTLDMDPGNDLVSKSGTKLQSLKSFVDDWEVHSIGEKDFCKMPSRLEFEKTTCELSIEEKGREICATLLRDDKLKECVKGFDENTLIAVCTEDYCKCANTKNRDSCVCDTVSMIAKDCLFKGIKLARGWRNLEVCPANCEKGRVFSPCGPTLEPTCGSLTNTLKDTCHEGCYCPEGMLQYKGDCILPEQCPCAIRNKEFKSGSKITKDCNTCTCQKGIWNCSDVTCGARCGAIGDPHYVTFDGKRYDFMGKCSYHLLKTGDLSVEAENVACPGSISAAMNLLPSTSSELPSCTKSVTIRFPVNGKDTTIKLAQGPVVYINDREVEDYPKKLGDDLIVIRQASSTFVTVDFANGIRVWWDGNTRVYIDAPASFRNKTQGLCGTFNSNTQDDFLTPEGDIETAVEPFADKWRTKDTCDFLSDAPIVYPCDTYPENRPKAEKYCDNLLSEVFEECHWTVDPEPFYENCMYDVCACKDDISACLCPILAAYGTECSRQGVNTNWRFSVKDCSLKCPVGQVYDECGDSCLRTCQDIVRKDICKNHCVEGCRCPHGEYLNDKNECIPAEKCPCWYDGTSFDAGYKEVRPGKEFLELCTCTEGTWECIEATPEDKERYPPSGALKSKCLAEPNSEFTKCVPNEPKTCKNMHNYVETFEDCSPGCVCKIGYVLDTFIGKCVLPEECSCHHAGRSYNDAEEIKEDCNTCKCKSGKWDCTKNVCASTCSVWGDSHFSTFDGKDFDFQGACDYVLSKGADNNGNGYTITIQNVLCGSMGVTCSKSLKIALSGISKDSITLSSDPSNQKSIEKYKKIKSENSNTFTIYDAGVFLVVEVLDLGLQVKWDHGTRVYVKLDDKWKRKVAGLCGNYNNDAQDDMKTPSLGVETSPIIFGHSWKLQDYCSVPTEPINACKEHAERENWAHIKCGILKSAVFKDCHSEVPYEKFLKRCIFDTCACDQGGDCECLCTALAAYAYACSLKGVEIKWRTPQLCPMQCDPHCSEYSPCTQPCPVETCDNFLEQGIEERMCLTETCFEGCHIKPCKEDMIYLNDSFSECVPKSTCKPICIEKDGMIYYEGDITRSDDCQTCRCTRKKEICSGAPCSTSPVVWPSTTPSSLPSSDGTENPLDICDPTIPHHEFPGDCYKFLHCMQQPSGIWTFVEKTCGPSMMFNPISMTCDHIRAVEILKPECLFLKLTSPTPSTHQPLIAPKCIETELLIESPRDCGKYLECMEVSNNVWEYVEKDCVDGKMFNPLIKDCDKTATVLAIKPNCLPITYSTIEPPTLCPPGKKWSECAIHCEKLCHYYRNVLLKKGICTQGELCEPGCIDIKSMEKCADADKFWRDDNSCVTINECPCISPNGELIKPHAIYESIDDGESKLCQCLDNNLICIPEKPVTVPPLEAVKPTTIKPDFITPSTEHPLIIHTTVSPPKHCNEANLIPIISGPFGLPDTAFAASSVLGSSFLPQYSRLHSKPSSKSNGSWSPGANDQMEYLQITFSQPTPIYGVVMQGSPIFDQYVTSFKITYSYDGGLFHYITDEDGLPQIFDGPVSTRKMKSSYFKIPVEAKVVRIYPLKWHGSISMRVELYGCNPFDVTPTPSRYVASTVPPPIITTQAPLKPTEIWPTILEPVEPICIDEMGVESGQLSPSQVKASSVLWPKPIKGKKPRLYDMLKLNSPIGWRPTIDAPNQFVLFDFLEPRNVTGIKTKGGPDGRVISYKVMFSKNGKLWNKVVTPDGLVQIFEGNYDKDTPKTNYFQYPIHAQQIKVVPLEWHKNINMRIEPIGCFHPYPESTVAPEPEPHLCPICPDVEINTLPMDENCKCLEPMFWNGKTCVDRNMCPCIVNHISYEIGSIYENDKCEECVCVLGGISQCTEKKCPPCGEGLRKDKSRPCTCICEPCPPFQRICPSSGDCIPEDLWCNGYQDCEDDELDCLKKSTTPAPHPPKEELFVNKTCPVPACPEGMDVELTGNSRERQMSQMFETSFVAVKSNNPAKKGRFANQKFVDGPEEEADSLPPLKCLEYICVFSQKNKSSSCPLPQCREGYEVEFVKSKDTKVDECVPYSCVPVRQKDAICKTSGKTFKTFDGTEFKYDPCNHVIVRDLNGHNWAIVLNVNCSNYPSCYREVIIKDEVNDYTLTLRPDLTVNLNGFDYTVRQLEKTSFHFGFIISQPGNTILVVSKKHGFWVSYDENGDVKVGVSSQYVNTVDGLCGYYNGNPNDDKRMPDGSPAQNTAEFGDSWFSKEVPSDYCKTQICAEDAGSALEICNSIKHEVFGSCLKAVDYDGFIAKCVEATCECLKGEKSKKSDKGTSCKCFALERFVKECLAAEPAVQLDSWRAIHDCQISCPSPLVYKDCYKRRCEPSCDTVGKNECPLLHDECFSGCFCPEGTVRKGEKCVVVTECKDCVCDGRGKSKYVTYDHKNFTFDGNCTYLLSRDIIVPGIHTFQVYATLAPCEGTKTKTKSSKSTCAQSLHILYGENIIHVQRSPDKSLQILVNGLEVKTLPVKKPWLHIKKIGGETVIDLPESQVEVISDFADNSFSIRVPSVKYGGKMEGLCGDCDGDPEDDLKINPKYQKEIKGTSIADIAETWQADDPKLGLEKEECVSEDILLNDCIVPDPEVDPCFKIFDEKLFGKCHFIVDPITYISACQQDLCNHGPEQKGACESLAAYAKECAKNGICIDWRKNGFCPYDECPAHMYYQPCGCAETCETVNMRDIFAVIDIRTNIEMESKAEEICSTDRFEGCFCPEGKVLNNDKCIPEEECTICDDNDHYPGDIWFRDKCTECTCNKQGKVECTKKECSIQEGVCMEGFYALKTSSEDECCPKFICVPEPTKPPSVTCPDAPALKCGSGQNRKLLTGKNGCQQFVCECKPLSECEQIPSQRPLKPGEKLVTETVGCCPSEKIVCDKLQCPPKPKKCDNEFYELIKDVKDDECCPLYKCAPPKNTCLVTINGVQTLKRFGDKWFDPENPCMQKLCSFGPEGVLIELEQEEMCDISCEKGFKYIVDSGKCCGKCVQVMCILADQYYKPGDVWFSADNCTKFTCAERGNQLSVTTYEETCPDISDCPEKYQYRKGCCTLCKPVPESLLNCLPESLAESETKDLVQVYQPMHGLCINKEPIRGFTECHGSCPSGSKYNRLSYGQDKICECCSIRDFQEMKIPLICADGYKVYKSVQVPSSCGCEPCDEQITSARMVSGVKGVKG